MAGVVRSREHRVQCVAPQIVGGGDEQLRFEIDGNAKGVSLRIGSLRKSLVASLPETVIDLIEIAAFVYAIDASVSRGGDVDHQMAKKWHRRFLVELPVRDAAFWNAPDLKQELEEALFFLSNDRFEFTFTQMRTVESERERYFDFGEEGAWTPDTVMLFSGGLDSFAGALSEVIEHKNKVALISHFSATKINPVQRALHKAMADKLGQDNLMHFPMRVQLNGATNKEGTHRTRSFLFAALGIATAAAFGKDRISFYENGVVSLNLPPVGNVLGTRATRTTHPQTLYRFERLFSGIFGKPKRVGNPFFWQTKTDIVQTIARLKMADQIAHTRSCADVHNQTKQYAHCGRCSQCIDRRFAILAAGLEKFDPEEAYRLDLMTGVRTAVQDKEVALSYVRTALGYQTLTAVELEQHFPVIVNAINYLDGSAATALQRLTELLRRHGSSITDVMRDTMKAQGPEQFPEGSLPSMFGNIERESAFAAKGTLKAKGDAEPKPVKLVFDRKRKILLIDDAVEITGAAYRLLLVLAEESLKGAGKGLVPLDFPFLKPDKIRDKLYFETEASVRRCIVRARSNLAKKFSSAGMDPTLGEALIENNPWHGYRLLPDCVVVRMIV